MPPRRRTSKTPRAPVAATVATTPDAAIISRVHHVHRMLHESVNYPPHAPRKATAAYTRMHHQRVIVEDGACMACGVRTSTLGDPAQNPHGATQLETHHWIVELALTNAIDLAKFNKRIVARLRLKYPNKAQYDHDFTQQEMVEWIDHDPENCRVLCDHHHRHVYAGIHSTTYPVWGAIDLVRDDFELIPLVTPRVPAASATPQATT